MLVILFVKRVDDIANPFYERVFRFSLPADDNSTYSFSGKKMVEGLRQQHKKFIQFNLTGDSLEDEKEIYVIRIEALKLKYTGDTIHVIKVHFTNENTYGDFIQLINIMHKDKHCCYTIYEDDFYIFGEPPTTSQADVGKIIVPLSL